jgi:hypothetical protein
MPASAQARAKSGFSDKNPVARVYRVNLTLDADFHQGRVVGIGLDRLSTLLGPDEVRFVRLQAMQRKAVLIAVHGNS